MPRASEFTQEIADAICARIMGGESLRAITADDDMPGLRTVYQWLTANEAFRHQYAHARDVQADTLADQILQISDDASADYDDTTDGPKLNAEHVQRSRLRVDARKWLAAKLAPKKYGEQITVDATVRATVSDEPMTDDQFAATYCVAAAAGAAKVAG